MEEADHLCTRVGIMNRGKLRCLGSQNRLKAKYGRGYQLQFDAAHGQARGGLYMCGCGCMLWTCVHVHTYVHINIACYVVCAFTSVELRG